MHHSLRNLVEKHDNIPLNVKLSILNDVSFGLNYLHGRNPPIIHRDLTPNNILLGDHLQAKISDLGIAKVLLNDSVQKMTKAPGTSDFMPPECFKRKPDYGLPLDVFSYGGVILYTTTQLWPTPEPWVVFDQSADRMRNLSELERRQQYLDKMTGGAVVLKSLVRSCLDDNPKCRPNAAEISTIIKDAKDRCNDSISPIMWWEKTMPKQNVKHQQQPQQLQQKELSQQQVCFKVSIIANICIDKI